jgi:hypothetical protein
MPRNVQKAALSDHNRIFDRDTMTTVAEMKVIYGPPRTKGRAKKSKKKKGKRRQGQ